MDLNHPLNRRVRLDLARRRELEKDREKSEQERAKK